MFSVHHQKQIQDNDGHEVIYHEVIPQEIH